MVLAGNDLTIDESVGILRVRSIRAELGLSARNPSMKGRCSNAGGLSAVRRDPLYAESRPRLGV